MTDIELAVWARANYRLAFREDRRGRQTCVVLLGPVDLRPIELTPEQAEHLAEVLLGLAGEARTANAADEDEDFDEAIGWDEVRADPLYQPTAAPVTDEVLEGDPS